MLLSNLEQQHAGKPHLRLTEVFLMALISYMKHTDDMSTQECHCYFSPSSTHLAETAPVLTHHSLLREDDHHPQRKLHPLLLHCVTHIIACHSGIVQNTFLPVKLALCVSKEVPHSSVTSHYIPKLESQNCLSPQQSASMKSLVSFGLFLPVFKLAFVMQDLQ